MIHLSIFREFGHLQKFYNCLQGFHLFHQDCAKLYLRGRKGLTTSFKMF